MSKSKNEIVNISINKFEEYRARGYTFLLCFIGKDTDRINKVVLESCNYYCGKHQKLKVYAVSWELFKYNNLHGGNALLNYVLKFQGGKEVKRVKGGYTLELHTLVTDTTNEFGTEQSDSHQHHNSARSDKTGEYSGGASGDLVSTVKKIGQKRKKANKDAAKNQTSKHKKPIASTSSLLPSTICSNNEPKYRVTSSKDLKMCLSTCKPGESVRRSPNVSPSRQQCSVQCGDTISLISGGRSTPDMPKSPYRLSPSRESPVLFQTSPTNSIDLIFSKRTPTRGLSPAHDVPSLDDIFSFNLPSMRSECSTLSLESIPILSNFPTRSETVKFRSPRRPSSSPLNSADLSIFPIQSNSSILESDIEGSRRGNLTQHSVQPRQYQPHNPSFSQSRPQRTGLNRRRRRATATISIAPNRILTPNTSPNRGNYGSL